MTDFRIPLLAAAVAAFAGLAFAAGLAAAAEAPDMELIKKGEEIFATAAGVGCASCHGPYAEGDVGIGPYNRGVGEAKIREALKSVEDMQFLNEELDEEHIKQIAAYYMWLGKLKLVKTLAKRGRFIPDSVELYPGTPVQMVVNNTSRFAQNFGSKDMNIKPFKVDGKEALDFIWIAPEKEGTFTLECLDCRIKGQSMKISVTKSTKPFVPVTPGGAKAIASAAQTRKPAPPTVVEKPVQVASTGPAGADAGTIQKGHELFLGAGEVGCAACHGPFAEGDVGIGPNNRGFGESKIRAALEVVEPMKFLHELLTDEQIRQVAAYYRWIGQHQLVKAVTASGRFFPAKIQIHPGTPVQLAIINRDGRSHKFSGKSMGVQSFDLNAHETGDTMWKAPNEEGSFTLTCDDCGTDSKLTVQVTKSVDAFVPLLR